jgi:hypothetical protein
MRMQRKIIVNEEKEKRRERCGERKGEKLIAWVRQRERG